jgi:hypothetical protein
MILCKTISRNMNFKIVQIIKPITKLGIEKEKLLGQDTVRPIGNHMGVKLLVAVAFERSERKDV